MFIKAKIKHTLTSDESNGSGQALILKYVAYLHALYKL